jgi:hypothetical protein
LRIAICAAVVSLAATVWAQVPGEDAPTPKESIMFAGSDRVFQAALADAFAPAGMAVVAAGNVPAPSLADLSAASRALADRAHATATVWLIAGPAREATLVTYDRERDRVLVRQLPYVVPLSPTQAAEAARTARTMLRALRVTPDVDQPPPLVEDAPAIRKTVSTRDRPELAASAVFGVRLGAPDADLGGGLVIAWRPDRLGIAVAAELGPTSDITAPTFAGTLLDAAVAVLGRAPLEVAPDIHVTPSAGLALHLVRLHGELDTMQPIRATRFDPAARIGGTATYRLNGNLEVGLAVSVDCLLDRQHYVAGDQQVLVIPRLQTMIGAIATLRVL